MQKYIKLDLPEFNKILVINKTEDTSPHKHHDLSDLENIKETSCEEAEEILTDNERKEIAKEESIDIEALKTEEYERGYAKALEDANASIKAKELELIKSMEASINSFFSKFDEFSSSFNKDSNFGKDLETSVLSILNIINDKLYLNCSSDMQKLLVDYITKYLEDNVIEEKIIIKVNPENTKIVKDILNSDTFNLKKEKFEVLESNNLSISDVEFEFKDRTIYFDFETVKQEIEQIIKK